MSFHSLLSRRVSAERSAVNLMGIPLYVICCFSLAAFNILSLYLIFDSLINMCLGVFLLGFILYGTLCFLDLIDHFLSHIREVFNYNVVTVAGGGGLHRILGGEVWIVTCACPQASWWLQQQP